MTTTAAYDPQGTRAGESDFLGRNLFLRTISRCGRGLPAMHIAVCIASNLALENTMAGYGTQMKMDKATKPCYNICGACGTEIASTEILCKECIKDEVDFRGGFQIQSGDQL